MFMREFDKAIEDYKEAIESKPLEYMAYRNLGHAYFHKKDYLKALESYTKVFEFRKEPLAEDFHIRGNCHLEMNNYQEALEDF